MKDYYEFDPDKRFSREEVGDFSEAAELLREAVPDEPDGMFVVFIHVCEGYQTNNIETMYPVKMCHTIYEAVGYAEEEIRKFYSYGFDQNEIESGDWYFLDDNACIEKTVGCPEAMHRVCIMFCPIAKQG